MEPLNNIDAVILISVLISMLIAFIRGFAKEMLSIVGLALFVILTVYTTPLLLPIVNEYIASKMLAQFLIFLLIMAIFYTIWIISTDKLIAKVRTSTLSFMDRLFGLIFGFLRAVIIICFCFLVVKIVLPEELEEGPLKESQYFMMAEGCSGLIEKLLPKDFIKDSVKSVEDINKTKKKEDTNDEKEKDKDKQSKTESSSVSLSNSDQEQMDKMFEMLVKPQIKNKEQKEKKEDKVGYNAKETNNLDRLIDITAGD